MLEEIGPPRQITFSVIRTEKPKKGPSASEEQDEVQLLWKDQEILVLVGLVSTHSKTGVEIIYI